MNECFFPSAKADGNKNSNEYGKVESNVLFIKQNLFARASVPQVQMIKKHLVLMIS